MLKLDIIIMLNKVPIFRNFIYMVDQKYNILYNYIRTDVRNRKEVNP